MPKVQDRLDHLGVDLSGKRLFIAVLGEKQNTVEVVNFKSTSEAPAFRGKASPRGYPNLDVRTRTVTRMRARNFPIRRET
jgi:hypothetical protein